MRTWTYLCRGHDSTYCKDSERWSGRAYGEDYKWFVMAKAQPLGREGEVEAGETRKGHVGEALPHQ